MSQSDTLSTIIRALKSGREITGNKVVPQINSQLYTKKCARKNRML